MKYELVKYHGKKLIWKYHLVWILNIYNKMFSNIMIALGTYSDSDEPQAERASIRADFGPQCHCFFNAHRRREIQRVVNIRRIDFYFSTSFDSSKSCSSCCCARWVYRIFICAVHLRGRKPMLIPSLPPYSEAIVRIVRIACHKAVSEAEPERARCCRFSRLLCWVWGAEQLCRALSEVCDLDLSGLPKSGVVDFIGIYSSIIR